MEEKKPWFLFPFCQEICMSENFMSFAVSNHIYSHTFYVAICLDKEETFFYQGLLLSKSHPLPMT